MSLETAVHMLALTDAPEEEADKIRMAAMELTAAQEMAKAEAEGDESQE